MNPLSFRNPECSIRMWPSRQRKAVRGQAGAVVKPAQADSSCTEEDLECWRSVLAGVAPILELPTDFKRKQAAPGQLGYTELCVSTSTREAILRCADQLSLSGAGQQPASSPVLLLTALQVLLGQYSRESDIVVGYHVSDGCSDQPERRRPVPMRVNLQPEDSPGSLRALFAANQQVAEKAKNHPPCSAQQLAERLGLPTDKSASPVFQVALAVEHRDHAFRHQIPMPDATARREEKDTLRTRLLGPDARVGDLPSESLCGGSTAEVCRALEARDGGSEHAPLDLAFAASSSAEGLCVGVKYRTDLFRESTARQLLTHWVQLLQSAGEEDGLDVPASSLAIMTADERAQVLAGSRGAELQWESHASVPTMLARAAEQSPDAIAVSSGGQHLSYTEFVAAVAVLADALKAKLEPKAGHEVMVALIMERGLEMPVVIFACAAVGAPFVPIDPSLPTERVRFMLADCNAAVVLVQHKFRGVVPAEFGGETVDVDDCHREQQSPPIRSASARVAEYGRRVPSSRALYCFYTSGTTGRPKGVVVEHGALLNRIGWLQRQFPLSESSSVLQKAAYGFGVAEWEFFWPLTAGARLVMAAAGGHKDPVYLHGVVEQEAITHLFFVPSMLAVLLELLALEQHPRLRAPQHVFCVGEALLPETAALFFDSFPEHAALHNLYGPTEGDMTFFPCPRGGVGSRARVPAGSPIDNSAVYVLDANQQPVPTGVPGEMCFAGVGTARGYLNLPELSSKAFLPNPFGAGRLYRTGDVGRWTREGELEYLGRLDQQVKLRGFRIELGEIEAQLRKCPGVTASAAALAGNSPATQRLVAFVTPASVDTAAAVGRLRLALPDYAVPSSLLALAAMPLNPNGKTDRRALLALHDVASAGSGAAATVLGPSDALETAVRDIWAELLGLPPASLGVDHDFVSLGGNSLLAGRVTSRIRAATGAQLPGTAMYTHSTIAGLSAFIRAEGLLPDKEQDTASGAAEDRQPRAPEWHGHHAGNPVVAVVQLVVVAVLLGVQAVMDVLDWLVLAYLWATVPRVVFWCAMPFVSLAVLLLAVVLVVVAKWIVLGRARPGDYPLWGQYYLRWWTVKQLVHTVESQVRDIAAETVLVNLFWRSLGASVGARASINADIEDPDLVCIGSDVELMVNSTVVPHYIEDGYLKLRQCTIGRSAVIGLRGCVAPGTTVQPGSTFGPYATTDLRMPNSHHTTACPGGQRRTQHLLRCCVGIPLLLLFQSLPLIPCLLALDTIWEALSGVATATAWQDSFVQVSLPTTFLFAAASAWVIGFLYYELYFYQIVLFKRLVVGTSKAGPFVDSEWFRFRKWLLERIVTSDEFEHAVSPFHSTELLSIKYRMMGARIGRRVQADLLHMVNHEHISVGDHAVLASELWMETTDLEAAEHRPITFQPHSNVLDRSLITQGTVVGDGAVLGSGTLAAGAYPPFSISTGSNGGRSILLKAHSAAAEALARGEPVPRRDGVPPTEEQLVAELAMRRHRSGAHWAAFNLGALTNAVLFVPLASLAHLLSFLIAAVLPHLAPAVFDGRSTLQARLISCAAFPLISLAVFATEVLFGVLCKWVVIGRYKEKDYPFYGLMHLAWVWMMALPLADDLEMLNGSVWVLWALRLFGARMGKDVCWFGTALEYDLLRVGDRSAVGEDTNLTCHTVENMVLKFAAIDVGQDCAIHGSSWVMPGGRMDDASILLAQSQVLKGETVGAGETWGGNPALRLLLTSPSKEPQPEATHAASP